MFDWNSIINWKIVSGSHDFPGPDGGTCINEAAIVAAGFRYKRINAAADCPPCFSPVLSEYLLALNDMMPAAHRQELMRFVTRLSGSADSPTVERQRLELIVTRTVQKIVSSAMRAVNLHEQAVSCRNTASFKDAVKRAASAADAAWAAQAAGVAGAACDAQAAEAASAASAARAAWGAWAAQAAEAARAAWGARGAQAAEAARAAADAVWSDCIAIAEEAFAIGAQAAEPDVAAVSERMEMTKRLSAQSA